CSPASTRTRTSIAWTSTICARGSTRTACRKSSRGCGSTARCGIWACGRRRRSDEQAIGEILGRGSRAQLSMSECEWCCSRRLRHVAQLEFLDFPGRGPRQVGENDVALAFVAGEVLATPGDDVLPRCLPSRLELDEGARRLAPFV